MIETVTRQGRATARIPTSAARIATWSRAGTTQMAVEKVTEATDTLNPSVKVTRTRLMRRSLGSATTAGK